MSDEASAGLPEQAPPPERPPPERNHGLLATLIARPVTVIVGLILVVLTGMLAIFDLPIQLTPDVSTPTITVTTRWPGASPAEVEAEILEEQEEALKSVVGLDLMESEASPDEARITLEFEVGTDLDVALVRVSNALTEVPRYPEAADQPVVATANAGGPPLSIIAIRSPEGRQVEQYRTWVDNQILPRIERIPGVASIRVRGGRDTEVHVDFDPAELAARGIRVAEVATAIRGELVDVSGGDVTVGKRRLLVRTPLAPVRAEDLEQIVIGSGPTGTAIRLGDVAKVEVGLRKAGSVAFTNDRPSLVLLLFRETGTNVLEVSQQIRDVVAELQTEEMAPEGLIIEVIDDQTDYIEGSLELVKQNLIMGAVLAIAVLLLFLRSVGASGLIGLSIPVSVFGTAVGMIALGRTVNIVSLAGTTFAVGMVVDASIVVLESIDTWRGRVDTMAEAALRGVSEVWGALVASTATTAAVFIPVLLWQDEVGELLRDVASAISVAVMVSLVVSVLALPSLAARFLKTRAQLEREAERSGKPIKSIEGGLSARARAAIGRQVGWLCRSPWRALLVVVASTTGSIVLALTLLPPMEYLPTGNRNLVFGILSPPPGYSVGEVRDMGERLQGKVAKHVGAEVEGVPAIGRSFFVGDPNQIFCGASAVDPTQAGLLAAYYRAQQAEVPGAFGFASQASLFGNRLGGGRAVEVDISGSDLRLLVGAGMTLMNTIRERIPGVQVRPLPSLELGAPELHVTPRRDETAGLGLGGAELGQAVDAMVDGSIIGEWGPAGERKIDVVLRGITRVASEDPQRATDTRLSASELATIPLTTPSGHVVPLGTLAEIDEQLGPTLIRRIERERAITLQITPPDDIALETAMIEIRAIVAELEQAEALPGVDTRIAGTAGKLEQAKGRFGEVLLLAVLIIYLLLAALYEDFLAPLVVLITVPMAAAGGVLGLLLANLLAPQAFDLITAVGFLILIGVVVNNAILVVDGALARLREGSLLGPSVSEAVEGRVRPIFMTTLTSLAGLVPMVVVPGSGSELYRGVGAIVLGGLALSTLLTIYVVPALFTLIWRLRGVR
ncbi:efflux RND transporter permease subunit [Nannocystaceae bacterium ST9]